MGGMAYVMRIEGLVSGGDTEYDGQYLQAYDPGWGEPGECLLETVADPAQAKRYAGVVELADEWRRVDPREPTRPDGLPNCPLTAFSISAEPLPCSSGS